MIRDGNQMEQLDLHRLPTRLGKGFSILQGDERSQVFNILYNRIVPCPENSASLACSCLLERLKSTMGCFDNLSCLGSRKLRHVNDCLFISRAYAEINTRENTWSGRRHILTIDCKCLRIWGRDPLPINKGFVSQNRVIFELLI